MWNACNVSEVSTVLQLAYRSYCSCCHLMFTKYMTALPNTVNSTKLRKTHLTLYPMNAQYLSAIYRLQNNIYVQMTIVTLKCAEFLMQTGKYYKKAKNFWSVLITFRCQHIQRSETTATLLINQHRQCRAEASAMLQIHTHRSTLHSVHNIVSNVWHLKQRVRTGHNQSLFHSSRSLNSCFTSSRYGFRYLVSWNAQFTNITNLQPF